MRAAFLIAALALPATASAGPWHDVIKQPPKRLEAGQPLAFTNVSHKIFLNRCPGGCTISPGSDDSRTNKSSIPNSQVVMTQWPHGDAAWQRLVTCVRDMYAPFDIQITDVDPGNADHFEVIMPATRTCSACRAPAASRRSSRATVSCKTT